MRLRRVMEVGPGRRIQEYLPLPLGSFELNCDPGPGVSSRSAQVLILAKKSGSPSGE